MGGSIRLGKTYYQNGFFNQTKDMPPFPKTRDLQNIEITLQCNGQTTSVKIRAEVRYKGRNGSGAWINSTHYARIYGKPQSALSAWFQTNASIGDALLVEQVSECEYSINAQDATPPLQRSENSMSPRQSEVKEVDLIHVSMGELREIGYPVNVELKEDEIKEAIEIYLQREGYKVETAYGHTRGADIKASRAGESLVFEVKGEASRSAMWENYFLAIIGEIVKRMNDASARYFIVLPAHHQFIRRVRALPDLATQKLGVHFIFCKRVKSGVYRLYQWN